MRKNVAILAITFMALSLGSSSNNNVYAESFNGEYSIDYLLRNYNVVTLGKKDINAIPAVTNGGSYMSSYIPYGAEIKKGDLQDCTEVKGAILINGDYKSVNDSTFDTEATSVKSFIKGVKSDNVSTPSTLVTNSNFIDFDKLYKNITSESRQLAEKAQYHINGMKLEISKPGIYTVHNSATAISKYNNNIYEYINGNELLIKDYNPNETYIFNYLNEYVFFNLPQIKIMESGTSNSVPLKDYINQNNSYTGNIIFNFPNANFIYKQTWNQAYSSCANVIAPNANIYVYGSQYSQNAGKKEYDYATEHYGNIIANTIYHSNRDSNYINNNGGWSYIRSNKIYSTNYKLSKKIIDANDNYYAEVPKDYEDDMYIRDYSIKDLLENYNLVTLGHKTIDSKSKLSQLGDTPGSVRLFHITGQALIAGDVYSKKYEPETQQESWGSITSQKSDRLAFDLESNEVTESYIKGNVTVEVSGRTTYSNSTYSYNWSRNEAIPVIQPWDNMTTDNYSYGGKKNNLFVDINNAKGYTGSGNVTAYINNNQTYLNFTRMYDNIVAEQSGIDGGKEVEANEDGILHIPIGGNYTIKDISKVKEVVFDNFGANKDKLTIITIKDSGDINFPLISKDGNGYKGIVTNDYYDKEEATHNYELDTFLSQDSYHGNIVWSAPNANYIKLKENAPFAGHLIAPNADVETPELHFAGAFIVNSIYGEGNTEAHFYPLTANVECNCNEFNQLTSDQKTRFKEFRLSKLLGGSNSIIEKVVLGNKTVHDQEIKLFESLIAKCDAVEENQKPEPNLGPISRIIKSKANQAQQNPNNPRTQDNIIPIVIMALISLGVGLYLTYKLIARAKK